MLYNYYLMISSITDALTVFKHQYSSHIGRNPRSLYWILILSIAIMLGFLIANEIFGILWSDWELIFLGKVSGVICFWITDSAFALDVLLFFIKRRLIICAWSSSLTTSSQASSPHHFAFTNPPFSFDRFLNLFKGISLTNMVLQIFF